MAVGNSRGRARLFRLQFARNVLLIPAPVNHGSKRQQSHSHPNRRSARLSFFCDVLPEHIGHIEWSARPAFAGECVDEIPVVLA